MEYILDDENHQYHHPFISLDEMQRQTCIICNDEKRFHIIESDMADTGV